MNSIQTCAVFNLPKCKLVKSTNCCLSAVTFVRKSIEWLCMCIFTCRYNFIVRGYQVFTFLLRIQSNITWSGNCHYCLHCRYKMLQLFQVVHITCNKISAEEICLHLLEQSEVRLHLTKELSFDFRKKDEVNSWTLVEDRHLHGSCHESWDFLIFWSFNMFSHHSPQVFAMCLILYQ